MKRVKSFAKIIIALLMALTLITLTACDVLDDFFGKGEGGTGGETTYDVTLNLDGGSVQNNLTSYTAGTTTTLPIPTKDYYDFEGWHEGSLSGTKVEEISATDTGDKTYYANWTPKTYKITLTINGDSSYKSSVTSYTYGTAQELPKPTKSGNTFNGWYVESDLSGSKISSISAGEHGVKTFYGAWVSDVASVTTSEVKLNTNGGTLKNTLTEYEEGKETELPDITKSGYTFTGWYTNAQCTGTAVDSIPKSATGKQEFWAGWSPISSDTLSIISGDGYEEGAYVEFNTVSGVDSYSVAYKTKNSAEAYTAIDSELVRINSSAGTGRADIVGIKKGDYTIQVTAGTQTKTTDVSVDEYDRSGYAHFNRNSSDPAYSGVGGYKDDGTPKGDAVIVYVDEEHKNTVTAKVNGSTKTGLKNILAAATSSSSALIVRIVGRIAAPTWEHEDHDHQMIEYTMDGSKISADEIRTQTYDKFKITLSKSSYTQDELIGLGFKLETGIAPLNGLTSTMSVASDTCWNDMQIGGSGNNSRPTNITVEGIGTDAEIFQWGLTWKYASSIEIRNLTFTDYTEDACSFQGNSAITDSQRIWLHNCTFNEGKNYWDLTDEQDKHDGDGSTDFKWATYITIAYNHYIDTHKTGLIGGGGSHKTSNVTFHHNYYQHCKARLPLGRQANMHMYNNYYEDTTDTCLSLRAGAYAFVENCYFKNAVNPIESKGETGATGEGTLYGAAKVYNCTFEGINLVTGTYIVKVASRTASVTNQNKFDQNFDTSTTNFYYDSANQKSKVTKMDETAKVPSVVKQDAGVHKN